MARHLGACLLLLACTACSAYPATLESAAEKPDLQKIEAFKARVKAGVPGASDGSASDVAESHVPAKAEALADKVGAWKGKVVTKILANVENGLGEVRNIAEDYVKKAIRNLTDEDQLNKPPRMLVDPAANVQNFAKRMEGLISGISRHLKSGGHVANEMTHPEKLVDLFVKHKHGEDEEDVDEEEQKDRDEEEENEEGEKDEEEEGERAGQDNQKSLQDKERVTLESSAPEQAPAPERAPPSSLLATQARLRGSMDGEPRTPYVAKLPVPKKDRTKPVKTVDIVGGIKDLGVGVKHLIQVDLPQKRKAAKEGLKKMKDGFPELGTKLGKLAEQIARDFHP
mmetsp:Transcript_28733/g.66937  ORF Transcript_28733/g.66937 Transcript_28733/m.66937 type:complete len:341 (-) Transcript_28733:98-1120(-)